MPLNEQEYNEFCDILNQAKADMLALTEWERGFITDFESRMAEYGDNVRISVKQWGILHRIKDKL